MNQKKINFIVCSLGVFMAGLAFSESIPFLPIYISTLGNYPKDKLVLLSTSTYMAVYISSAIMAPIWGKLTDRLGPKKMILKSTIGLAFSIGIMGIISAPYQLIILRVIQGFFSGFISTSNSFVAKSSQNTKLSTSRLAKMESAHLSGVLLGPMVGGLISTLLGYRFVFIITGIIFILIFLFNLKFLSEKDFSTKISPKNIIKKPKIDWTNTLLSLLFTTAIFAASNATVNPIITLYLKTEFLSGNTPFLIGFIIALPGISAAIFSNVTGKLANRFSAETCLLNGLTFAVILFILQSLTKNLITFVILRFLIGISDALIVPSVLVLLNKITNKNNIGSIFGFNQSARSIGQVLGSILTAIVATLLPYSQIFMLTAFLELLNLILCMTLLRLSPKS